MKTETLPNEEVLKSGPANHQRGAETAGGKLHLTNQRLVFEAHKFNLDKSSTIIALSDVTGTEFCWTKFLNLIPLAPNSLAVSTTGGEQHKFVLTGRAAWKTAIDAEVIAGKA